MTRAALMTVGALAVFALTGSGCSTVPERAWCSNLTELSGRDCSYDTFQQCMAEIRGLSNGNCTENPRYRSTTTRSRA